MSRVEELEAMLAEEKANEKLIAAKEAFRSDPSPKNRKARQKAIDAVLAAREIVRKDRTGPHASGGE